MVYDTPRPSEDININIGARGDEKTGNRSTLTRTAGSRLKSWEIVELVSSVSDHLALDRMDFDQAQRHREAWVAIAEFRELR